MYRLAVLDIDGTICRDGKIVSDVMKETLSEMQRRGIHVSLCTGRCLGHTLQAAEILGLRMPVMAVNGALGYDMVKCRDIFDTKPQAAAMLAICDLANEMGMYIESVTRGNYLKYFIKGVSADFDYEPVNDFALYPKEYAQLRESVPESYQLVIGGDSRQVEELKRVVDKEHPGVLGYDDSMWENYIFIGPPQIGKASGVRRLCGVYGIDIGEVVAIGDDINDLDMLEAAGMGVAMGNAHPRAKAAADFITENVENDGAALALRKFFEL